MSYQNTLNTNLLIKRDRRNVVIGSLVILLLGIGQVGVEIIFLPFNLYSLITMCIGGIYIITGLFGITAAIYYSICACIAYLIILCFIMFLNILILIGSIFIIVYDLIRRSHCSNNDQDCTYNSNIFYSLLIITGGASILSMINCCFIKAAFTMGKKFKNDMAKVTSFKAITN